PRRDHVVGGGIGRLAHRLLVDLDAVPDEPAIVRREAEGEGKQPRAHRTRRVVASEIPEHLDEDVVRHVLEVAGGHPEAPQRGPDVRELAVEQRAKIARTVERAVSRPPLLDRDFRLNGGTPHPDAWDERLAIVIKSVHQKRPMAESPTSPATAGK